MNLRSTEKKGSGTAVKQSSLRPPLKTAGKPPLNYFSRSNTKSLEKEQQAKQISSRLPKTSQNINQSKTPVRSRPNATAKSKITPSRPVKVEDEADEAVRLKRILEWRERFKHMRFYFDGIEPALVAKFRKQIRQLDGTVDQFLSYNITHLVTGNPDAIDVSRNVDPVGISGPDVIFIAKKLEVSLWTTNRLENVLEAVCNPHALQEALHQEKMLGANPSRREVSNFKKFSGYYLLVEEPSGAYKPVAVKEYELKYDKENPPWPKLRLHNHSSQTVFARKSNNNNEEEVESTENSSEDEENQAPEDGQAAGDVAASGFFSGSVVQAVQRKVSSNPVLAKIAMRVTKETKKRQRGEAENQGDDEDGQTRVKRNKKYHVYPMIFQKTGYCENCNVKYDDYATHIRCSRHRKYATNPLNFAILESIFKGTKRIPKQESTSEDSVHSRASEDGSEDDDFANIANEEDVEEAQDTEEGDEDEEDNSSSQDEMEETNVQESVAEEDQIFAEGAEAATGQVIPSVDLMDKAAINNATCNNSDGSNSESLSFGDGDETGSDSDMIKDYEEISDSEAKSSGSDLGAGVKDPDSEELLNLSASTNNAPTMSIHMNCNTNSNCLDYSNMEVLEDTQTADKTGELAVSDVKIPEEIVLVLDKLDHEYHVQLVSGKTIWMTMDYGKLPDIVKKFEMERAIAKQEKSEFIVAKQFLSDGSNLSSIPSLIESALD